MAQKVEFPLDFSKGMNQFLPDSVLPEGYTPVMWNYEPMETGGFRVRRGWRNSGTSGTPATRRTRGIGTFAQQLSYQSPAQRQTADSYTEGATSQGTAWTMDTVQDSLLLAGVTVRRRPQLVQQDSAEGQSVTSTSGLTWPAATTNGSFLLALVVAHGITGSVTITPPAGWTSLVSNSQGQTRASLFYIANAAPRSGSEAAFTFSLSSAYEAVIMEWANIATASPVDTSNVNQGVDSTAELGSITTTQADTLIVGAVGSDEATSWSPPAGWTEVFNARVGSDGPPAASGALAYKTVDVAGSQGGTFTAGAGSSWASLTAALKVNTTAPTITPPAGWTSVTEQTHSSVPMRTGLFHIVGSAPRSGSETFTPSVYSMVNVSLLEYTGIATSSATDGNDTGKKTSGSSVTASLSASYATGAPHQDLFIVLVGDGTIGGEQTASTDGFTESGFGRQSAWARSVIASTSVDPDITLSPSSTWCIVAQAYKARVATTQGSYVLAADYDGTDFDIYSADMDALDTATWSLIDSNVPDASLDSTIPVVFASGIGVVLWTHPSFTLTRQWDGTTVSNVGNAPRGRAMTFYRNRYFIGGTLAGSTGSGGATSNVGRLWFSNLGSATTWGALDYIDVNQQDNEPIEDIAATNDGLLIAKRNSLWFLSGTGPDTFSLHRLNQGSGYQGRCICVNGYGALIAGKNHVWVWSGGNIQRVSGPLESSYTLQGSEFVSTACIGERVYICASNSSSLWVHDLAGSRWWLEHVNSTTDFPTIVYGHDEMVMMGPRAGTTYSLVAHRHEPDGPRARDISMGELLIASTPMLFLGTAVRPFTPHSLYLQIRQRGGDDGDASLIITPVYDSVNQPTVSVAPRSSGSGVFYVRRDVGSAQGLGSVGFTFAQTLTTADDAILEVERATLVGVMGEPH